MSQWTKYMTKEMLDVVDVVNMDYMKSEFLFCHENYIKAKESSNIKLPALAHSGEPVRSGARSEVGSIADYWEIRRDLVKQFLPREWVEEQGVNSMMFKR
jgi:hypothetical protein